MTASPVVCVFGISGVGKTTLIREALEQVTGGLHLEASALIKQGLADPAMNSEELRRAGGERVLANQQILVTMFQRAVGQPASVVVFDGHLVIDGEDRLVEIPCDVIAALGPAILVHVEDIPEAIVRRRQADQSRRRAERSRDVLGGHQVASRLLCTQYSKALNAKMLMLGPASVEELADILKSVRGGR